MKTKKNKLVYGVGLNDADYHTQTYKTEITTYGKKVQTREWYCPFYKVWISMLARCYSDKLISKYPTYAGCSVCDEWLIFSNFKAWMEQQEWEGKTLDKDILVAGNKVYSPKTCCFVPPHINSFVLDRAACRGDWPVGTYFQKSANKFQAKCNDGAGTQTYLGLFDNPEDAHLAWKSYKHKLALAYATTLEVEGYPKNLVDGLRTRYL